MSSSRVEVKEHDNADAAWSIGEVAELFGIKTSTLRYWEQEHLLCPAGRRSGQRFYDRDNLRKIALIMIAKDTGLMELGEIRTILDGPSQDRTWREAVSSRLDAIDRQRERLESARAYLAHFLTCPSEHPAQTCPYLAAEIDLYLESPHERSSRRTPPPPNGG